MSKVRRAMGIGVLMVHFRVLALGILLLPAGLIPPASNARADEPNGQDPVARLQLVVKSVHVFDDQDWGEGDITLNAHVWQVNDARPGCVATNLTDECVLSLASSMNIDFGADSGDTIQVNRTVPEHGGFTRDKTVSSEIGFPVFAGKHYGWAIDGIDRDTFSDDELGTLLGELTEQNGWGIGTWNERGVVRPGCHFVLSISIVECDFSGEGLPAYYSAEYEFRRVPLPDLQPMNIRPDDVDGKQYFCLVVQNIGQRDSDTFQVTTRTDDTTVLSVATLPGLAVDQSYEHCVLPQLPAGEHALSFTIDEARQVPEMNELNNQYRSKFTFRGSAAPGGTGPRTVVGNPVVTVQDPPSGSTQSDLLVSAIRVKGKDPTGINDCDPGKNDITVVVKNQGEGPAASFLLTLAIPDGQTENNLAQTLTGLAAGKEQEVLFKDVDLKKGEHKLTATADADGKLKESNEGNNSLGTTVKCKEEGD